MAPPASPPTPAPTSARWRRSVASPPLSRRATTPLPAPISAALRVRLGSSGALVWPVYAAQLLSRRLSATDVAIAAVVDARTETPRRSVLRCSGGPQINPPPPPRGRGGEESGR